MAELNIKKVAFEAAIREGLLAFSLTRGNILISFVSSGKSTSDIPKEMWWTSQEGRLLEDEVEKAKHGLLFLGMK